MKSIIFGKLNIGDTFILNGNEYVKKSTRTAKPLFDCHVGYFYVGINEIVKATE